MSSGEPSRFSAMFWMSRCWPSSPIASHCRSVVGLERTKPGATLLTVMFHGPELVRELAREADLPGLGAGIGLDAGEADAEPGAARDVDDPPVALRLHARRDRLRHEEAPERLTSKIVCQSRLR